MRTIRRQITVLSTPDSDGKAEVLVAQSVSLFEANKLETYWSLSSDPSRPKDLEVNDAYDKALMTLWIIVNHDCGRAHTAPSDHVFGTPHYPAGSAEACLAYCREEARRMYADLPEPVHQS